MASRPRYRPSRLQRGPQRAAERGISHLWRWERRRIALNLANDLELDGSVHFFKPSSVREIAAIMAQADLGVVPKRADSFGNEAYSTKIMEFMAVGVPVVVSNTKVDRFYFDDSVVRFFESGDSNALAQKMLELLRNPDLRREMIARALEYAARNSWQRRKADYLEIVDSICDRKRSSRRRDRLRVDPAGGLFRLNRGV